MPSYRKASNERLIFLLFYFALSASMYLPGPYFVLYLNTHIALSWIGLSYSLNRLSNLLFEYPSGIFADEFGRLKSTMVGTFLFGMSMILLTAFRRLQIHIVLLSAFLGGAGMAFISGSLEAWAVDEFGKNYVKRLFSDMGTLKNISGVVASILSGILVKYWGLEWPLFLSGLVGVFSPVVLLFLPDNRGYSGDETLLRKNLRLFRNIDFSMLVFLSLIVSSMLSVFFVVWPVTLKTLGAPESILGPVYFSLMLSMSLGSYIARRVSKPLQGVSFFLISGAIITAAIGLMVKWNTGYIMVLGLLYVLEVLIGLYYVFMGYIRNSIIPSEIRASAISLISLMNSAVGVVLLPLFLSLGKLHVKWIICSLLLTLGLISLKVWKTYLSSVPSQSIDPKIALESGGNPIHRKDRKAGSLLLPPRPPEGEQEHNKCREEGPLEI
ncbi:MFS transporter [Thermococcus sp. P6]|uniref:MFS transporter n=1 Tax=Thermococcus sp. P6 TaxID=122420 RepID=UPI000B5988C8|nr:MFS transporter [Thermococcus sp. P6]